MKIKTRRKSSGYSTRFQKSEIGALRQHPVYFLGHEARVTACWRLKIDFFDAALRRSSSLSSTKTNAPLLTESDAVAFSHRAAHPDALSGVTCRMHGPRKRSLHPRPSEIRTMSLTPLVASFSEIGRVTALGHGRFRMRTGILQNENILGINLEALIVDASSKVFHETKIQPRDLPAQHNCASAAETLEDRTLRCQISERRNRAALSAQVASSVRNDGPINPLGTFVFKSPLVERFTRRIFTQSR